MLGMLVYKAIEIYINWKAVYSPSAVKRYKPRLLKFIAAFPEVKVLEDLTSDDITRFHKGMELKNYSRATIAYSLTVMKNFLVFWKNRGVSVPDPKEIKSITFTSRIKPIVSPEDFEKLSTSLSEFNFMELKIKLALHLLWDTGMRVSELIDLNLSDISDPNEMGIRTAQIVSKKSAKYNLVAWSKETDRLLCLYLGVRLDRTTHSNALFTNTKAKHIKRLDVRTIQRWVKIASSKAGISKALSPHSFRHGKAHHMLNNGANIRDVQAVLRHINPITTFHYLSLNQKHFLEVASKHLKAIV